VHDANGQHLIDDGRGGAALFLCGGLNVGLHRLGGVHGWQWVYVCGDYYGY
jgi:hypothetical protein